MIKLFHLTLAAGLLSILASCTVPPVPDALRYVPTGQSALTEWEFSKDGSNWERVAVPHSYNGIDGQSATYYRGPATYRTTVQIADPATSAFLIFEGAAQAATVYVNGKKASVHKGGYTAFVVPMAGLLLQGKNLVEVICDNTEDLELIPVSSDFNKNGGLHNPVWLYVPGRVYFDPSAYGLYRLHVTQTAVTDARADATVQAILCGKADVTLKVRDRTGKTVYEDVQKQVSGAYHHNFSLARPHLWNGLEDPYLYTVELTAGSDKAMTEVGFRYYSVDREKGFSLNGHPYALRGVSMHQDMHLKASALSYEEMDADYEVVKELGCNFLRLAHYPHNDYAFRLCDRLGIVVQTEIPWVNICGVRASEAYFDNIHAQMEEMIRNLYNHPSIVFWGMWNELDSWGNTDRFQGPLDARRVVNESARLYNYAKTLDSTRFVGLTDDSVFGRDFYTELKADYYSENRYHGWYYNYGVFSGITEDMVRIKETMGPANISEYGVGINPFCHTWKEEDIRRYRDDARHMEEYGNLSHEAHAQQIAQMPWLNFTSLWILFDFPVADRKEGYMDSSDGIAYTENPARLYMNDKGLVTRDRQTKKDVFYLYKSWWNHQEETVYITGRRLTARPAGEEFTLTVYSNAPSLTLLKDGEPVCTKDNSGEPTGVIWKFQGLTVGPSGTTFTVRSSSGKEDSVHFKSLSPRSGLNLSGFSGTLSVAAG
jgi:beta-galactosidase